MNTESPDKYIHKINIKVQIVKNIKYFDNADELKIFFFSHYFVSTKKQTFILCAYEAFQ